MRVADGDRRTIPKSVSGREIELSEDRFPGRPVVEEHFARGRANARALGSVKRDGRGSRAAINEEKPSLPQRRHQDLHQFKVSRGTRTLVVVHSRYLWDGPEHARER